MSGLTFACVAFVFAITLPELVLRRSTMLAELGKVVLIHACLAVTALVYFLWSGAGSFVALGVAWVGAFLTWLTARSHVSSSILLRMVHMLREQPLPPSELVALYQSDHAPERARLLARGGLVRGVGPDRSPTLAGRILSLLGNRLSAPRRR